MLKAASFPGTDSFFFFTLLVVIVETVNCALPKGNPGSITTTAAATATQVGQEFNSAHLNYFTLSPGQIRTVLTLISTK